MRIQLFMMLLVASTTIRAQEDTTVVNEVTIDAEILTRGEIRRGGLINKDNVQDAEKANFVIERARLGVGYKRDALSMQITCQHHGVWGMEGSGNNFKIYEAWAQLAKYGLFLKVGRQELVYDDERILGDDDWATVGLTHDVLKAGYEGYGHKVHLLAAYNQNNKNTEGGTFYTDGELPYKSMQGVWYHYDVPKFPLGVSLILLNVGMESGVETNHHIANQQCYGGYLTFRPKRFSLELSYYRQSGKASLDYSSGNNLPLRAWMGNVKASYDVCDRISSYAGYDYISGDDNFVVPKPGQTGLIQHKELTAFTWLYGSSRNFYGAMDFFYVSNYFGSYSPGLQNLFAGAVINPVKRLLIDCSYHYMATATKVPELDMSLGHMIDVSAVYELMPDVSVSAGYSYMSGTETMERLKRSTEDRKLHWGWVMLKISPRIFSTKWK